MIDAKNYEVYFPNTGTSQTYSSKRSANTAINNAVKNGEMTRKEGAQRKKDAGTSSGS